MPASDPSVHGAFAPNALLFRERVRRGGGQSALLGVQSSAMKCILKVLRSLVWHFTPLLIVNNSFPDYVVVCVLYRREISAFSLDVYGYCE